MTIIIRSANLPQDYAGIAAVLAAESPEWAATAEELAHEDAERDPHYHQAVFVAEEMSGDTPLMIGVAFVGHDTLAHREGKFIVNLRVHPDWQGRGAGKALYQATLDHLAPLAHGNRRLWVVNDSVNTAMLALNAKLGFQREGAMIRFAKRMAC